MLRFRDSINRSAWLHIGAIASGGALAWSLSGPGARWLAWVALVPLLIVLLSSRLSPRQAGLLGWVCGLIFYGLHFSYAARILHPALFLVVLAYLALYPAAFAAGVVLCGRRSIDWGGAVAPCLWTALELVRSNALSGLPAGTLGSSQVGMLPVIQIASVTGVLGVSFLLVTVNVALSRLIIAFREPSRRSALVWAVAAGVLVALTIGYGVRTLRTPDGATETLRVATVQGEIDERGRDRDTIRHTIFDRYRMLTAGLRDSRPQLIVYPETMTGSYLLQDRLFLMFITEMARITGSEFLVGSRNLTDDGERYRLSNSVFLIDSTGRVRDRYDKSRLAPFGEYTPLAHRFPWLTQFRLSGLELTPGTRTDPLQLANGTRIGVGICYEAMFGSDLRRLVRNGAQLLVIVSDDVWFEGTGESRQLFSEAALRAVENRMPVVRCANMGLSGMIDSRGRVTASRTAGQEGVVCETVRLRAETALYTRMGDVLAWGCGIASLAMVGWCLRT